MFTEDDIKSIQGYQACGWFHPYTCDCHLTLIPKTDGMYCPVHGLQLGTISQGNMALNNEWQKYNPFWFPRPKDSVK